MSGRTRDDLVRRMDEAARRFADKPTVTNLSFAVSGPSAGFDWQSGDPDQPFFIASATKLFTTAILLQLRAEGRLDLDAPAAHYLPAGRVDGLNTWRGVDHGAAITIRQLMAHTSGIADYFEQRSKGGRSVADGLLDDPGADRAWTADEALEITRARLAPRFAPGAAGKAFYSDTNFQVLGLVIEALDGRAYAASVRERVVAPLGLERTYVLGRPTSAGTTKRRRCSSTDEGCGCHARWPASVPMGPSFRPPRKG